MKSKSILSLALLSALTAGAFAQGSLTPPAGAPAPVMKTLQEVYDKAAAGVTRTPLVAGQPGVAIDANGTITISQSGSYILTGNRTITAAGADGIIVTAQNVTVDLNGYTLSCTVGNGGYGIDLRSSNGVVLNGRIVGGTSYSFSTTSWTLAGWARGIQGGSSSGRVSDVTVTGAREHGIYFTSTHTSMVERCNVKSCRQRGIFGHIINDCAVDETGSDAIDAPVPGSIVSRCRVNTHEIGINVATGTVSECSASSANSTAIIGDTVLNSRGTSSGGTGISGTSVLNCTGTSVSGTGISATMASNCFGSSTSGVGLSANTSATNSFGRSTTGTYGMDVDGTASFCQGMRSGGTAIRAAIAIGCTSAAGTITAPQKHLGTP